MPMKKVLVKLLLLDMCTIVPRTISSANATEERPKYKRANVKYYVKIMIEVLNCYIWRVL
jgi:hypothetical protein